MSWLHYVLPKPTKTAPFTFQEKAKFIACERTLALYPKPSSSLPERSAGNRMAISIWPHQNRLPPSAGLLRSPTEGKTGGTEHPAGGMPAGCQSRGSSQAQSPADSRSERDAASPFHPHAGCGSTPGIYTPGHTIPSAASLQRFREE